MGTLRLAGTLRTREHPQGCRAARSPPACRSSGRLCLLHSVPRSPGLGRAGPPQPLSGAGCGLGVSPAAFGGGWRPELGPEEGDEEAPMGHLQREHPGTAAPGLLHTVAPQCPNIPANVRAAGGASPATSGASADRTCALGRRAQGILHSSAWIVTTLWTWTSHMEAPSAHQPSLVWWLQEPEPRQGPRSCVL